MDKKEETQEEEIERIREDYIRTKVLLDLEDRTRREDRINHILRYAAGVFFICLIVFDKGMHLFVPPIPEHYYGISAGVALMGKSIAGIWLKLNGKP